MTIFYRYVTREIAFCFLIVLVSVMGIYVAVDFFEKIDNFLEADVPVYRCGVYLLYKLPFILVQIAPMGFLVAVLVAIGLMIRNREVLAMTSCGISQMRLLQPVLGAGVICGVVLFCIAEWIMPVCMSRANQIWLQEVRKKNIYTDSQNIWLRSTDRIIHITQYDPGAKQVFDVTVYRFDDQFNLIERIDAPSGVFLNTSWRMTDAMRQTFDAHGTVMVVETREKLDVRLGIQPQELTDVVKGSDEMSMAELGRRIEKVKKDGSSTTRYQVDYANKGTLAFVCVLLGLLGTGIALKATLHEAMARRILYGLAAAFLYWTFGSFCLSLGYAEMLPPLISAWVANGVFLCVAGLMLLSER
ncbi:LPS export ABC transporter permease LptG [Desulfosarcina sp. OttesenSCG-928-A07]|nr:LPS export ABC transporter permease LptG [Desulfosarcina sp. OttesenSCG-928-G17]MDL2329923.1 LPS export ABC transporter permease LptG [Desulfosarcina sp. OttesenSCG-928-A07]